MVASRPTTHRRSRIVAGAVVSTVAATALLVPVLPASAADASPTGPVVKDGQSQPVFNADPTSWIRQELWVETESDSDHDGRRDRVHVSLARPAETATGVRVPVIYEDSPYYAGGTDISNWSVDHELGAHPPATRPGRRRTHAASTSPIISKGYETTWIPRGFAVVHSESPGTGLSEGCPTSGGRNETLGATAVVDWLNGRRKAYATLTADRPGAGRSWTTGNAG